MAATENSTSTVSYEWEYYYDYLDPVIVDGSKLQYNKYSIVIIFWIFLAAFVGFLFLFLNLMSSSGNYSICVPKVCLTLPGDDVITHGSEGCLWFFGCFLFLLTLGSGHQTDMRQEQLC
uniref:Melanocortin-2 receptor accessory protein n=1 Tax=Scophthalmus maximus TaxID=52904 RepID=A0A8D2ZQX9_SCOMX